MPVLTADVAEVVFYTEDSTAPCTILKPAGFAPSQLLLAVVTQNSSSGGLADLTAPSGWAQEGSYADAGSNAYGKVFSHVYDAADPASWDFGYNSGADMVAALVRVIHPETTPTVVVSSDNVGPSGGTATGPSVTPTGINDLIVATLTVWGNGTAFGETDPSGYTNWGQAQVVGNYQALAVASRQLTDGNATGTLSWTAVTPGSGAPGGTFTIAILSSETLDPDPPLKPPAPELPPWLLRELLTIKARDLVGHQNTPLIKERLSGGASGANVTLITAATTDTTDLLVCFHGNNFDTAPAMTTPTGTAGTWTLRATGDQGTDNSHIKCWTRPVTADGAQTVTVAPTSSEEVWQHLFVISGADLTDPVDGAAGGNGAASTSHIAPSVSPATLNPLLLCAVQGAATIGTYTPPPGMLEQTDLSTPGFGAGTSASQELATSGPTGTRTFTSSVSNNYAAVTVAIKAAPPPAPGGGDATITPATVEAVAAIPAPTVVADNFPTPATVAAIADVPAPTIRLGVDITPATVAATADIGAPTIQLSVAITPATVVGVATVGSPTLSAGSTLTPSTVAATAAVGAPTLQTGSTVTPATVNAVASIGSPAVSAGGSATITPTTVAAAASIPAPTVQTSSTISPATVAATAAVGSVTVKTGSTVVPATVAAVAAIPTPAISTGTKVSPATVAAAAAVGAPTIRLSVQIGPATVGALATIGAPTMVTSTTAAPATVHAQAAIATPTVTTIAAYTPVLIGIDSSTTTHHLDHPTTTTPTDHTTKTSGILG